MPNLNFIVQNSKSCQSRNLRYPRIPLCFEVWFIPKGQNFSCPVLILSLSISIAYYHLNLKKCGYSVINVKSFIFNVNYSVNPLNRSFFYIVRNLGISTCNTYNTSVNKQNNQLIPTLYWLTMEIMINLKLILTFSFRFKEKFYCWNISNYKKNKWLSCMSTGSSAWS